MSGVKQVAVFAENKLGQMARVTKVLSEAGINIRAVQIASSESFGVIKFIVDKPDLAYQKFKEKGFTASLNEVLALEMNDRPGGLYAIAELLSKNNVNVENAAGFVIDQQKQAVLIIEVKDVPKAKEIIIKNTNLRLFEEKEISK
jgi:hypothetical protein